MKIGLFFGSFNPIHFGHLMLAQAIVDDTDINQIWFVVSPQSPFKSSQSLASEYDRLKMVELAIEGNDDFKASQIEFSLPKPSFTNQTLVSLRNKHPNKRFSLIMGYDNLVSFHKWKNSEQIAEHHDLIVFRRHQGADKEVKTQANYSIFEFPHLELSASEIRHRIQQNKSIQYMTPNQVHNYIDENHIYS